MSSLYEDKKCRICGLADEDNEFIFHTRDRYLVKKIAAVYSIWVTPTDPLPKCICSKCFSKVSTTYKSYASVRKQQTKWLENVATQEPDHNYLQILKFLDRANVSIKNFIESNYGDKLCKDAIESLLINALSGLHERPRTASTVVTKSSHDPTASSSHVNAVSNGKVEVFEISKSEESNHEESENLALAAIATNETPENPSEIVKCKYCPLKFESLKLLAVHQVDHMSLSLPKLFQPKCLEKDFRRGRLISVQSRQSIRCLNCYLVFDDNKCILEHWSKAECDFYCHICGAEFAQSPKLLREHVSDVHGISYRSLKMQRDLSFLSSAELQPILGGRPPNKPKHDVKSSSNGKQKVVQQKMDFNQLFPTDVSSSGSTTPPSHTHSRSRSPERPIKCRICNRDFRNFKACNSHMRAHKPPYAYDDDDEQLPNMNTDAYMEPEIMNYETETPPPKLRCVKSNSQAPTCSSTSTVNSTPPPPIAVTSNAYVNDFGQSNSSSNTESVDMELETMPQVNSSTSNPNSNSITNTNLGRPNTMSNLPSTSPPTSSISSKPTTTSTAPRGIRMKFVNRRSDLVNGANPAIKVKSLNDLKAAATYSPPAPAPPTPPSPLSLPAPAPHVSPVDIKPLQCLQTCPPLLPPPPLAAQSFSPSIHIVASTDLKPLPGIATNCPTLQIPLTALNPIQSPTTCPPQISYDSLRTIQNVPTCPPQPVLPPIQHASVIVNSLHSQPISPTSLNLFEPPMNNNVFMHPTVKDEPMEFI